MMMDCKSNSQCNTDNSGRVGNQSARCDFGAFHRKDMPGTVHQYVQPGRNPQVEIPFNVHPAEIECTDKGYAECSERRKKVVPLIEMHGTKIEGW